MWIVEKFTKNSILSQIRLSDAADIKQTLLYKLARDSSLSHFKKVFFIGSTKDTYAPFESSLVQDSQRLKDVANYGSIITMQKKILERVKHCDFYRVNVNTTPSKNTLDNYLGRQAHIQFIDNLEVIKMVIYRYDKLFA